MRFYTNVQMVGNNFLVRGYENGEKVIFKEEYSPTLFVKSKKPSKYKTLEGENVEPIRPGSVRDCREFYKKYDDIDGFDIYGMRGMYINISLTNIQKKKLSLILARSN